MDYLKTRKALDILKELVDAREDLQRLDQDPTDLNQVKMNLRRQYERRLNLLWEEAEQYAREA